MKLKERARKKKNSNSIACASLAILATLGNVLPQPAQAQSLPSIIDPGRIAVPEDNVKELSPYLGEREPAVVLEGAPEGASQIFFVLQDLQVRGVTVFSDEDIQFLYSGLLGQNISLAEVWRIAASLTQLYRREGFFLSKAFVPKQEIEGGRVVIQVYEGYLTEVQSDDFERVDLFGFEQEIDHLLSERPIRFSTLERFMLLLNDLPGKRYRSFIEPSVDQTTGQNASRVVVVSQDTEPVTRIQWDTSGSNLVGRHRFGLVANRNLFSLHSTELSVLGASPNGNLEYIRLSHSIPVTLDGSIELTSSHSSVNPGGELLSSQIRSDSVAFDISYTWNLIRQRSRNLELTLTGSARSTRTDILDTVPLVRERVRSASLSSIYTMEMLGARHSINATLTSGFATQGSSKEGDNDLSRSNAAPDFSLLRAEYVFQKKLSADWDLTWATSGQAATKGLYSFDEFGYGGINYGKAYEASQFTGDHGISTRVELRTSGWSLPEGQAQLSPYLFYDLGRVWNINDASDVDESASSMGFGFYLFSRNGFFMNVGIGLRDRVYGADTQKIDSLNAAKFYLQLDTRL